MLLARPPFTGSIAPMIPSGPLPTDLANLELWLPISALSGADDSEILTWPDQSGNGRDATGTGVSLAKPRYKTAGGPTGGPSVQIGLAGTFAGLFSLPNFASAFTSGEIFHVIQVLPDDPPIDSGSNMGAPSGDWGTGTASLYPFADGVIYDSWGSTVRKTTTDPVTNLTAWHLYNIRSASASWQRIISAATSTNDFFTTATNTVAFGTAPLIGKSGTRTMQGRMVETIMYSRVLDQATERGPVVNAYLNNTYGFAFPTS
jgi:hypothetical protein